MEIIINLLTGTVVLILAILLIGAYLINRDGDRQSQTYLRYGVDLSDLPTITNPELEQCAKNGYHICELLKEMPDEVSLRALLDKEYEKVEFIKAAHAAELEQWKTLHNVVPTVWTKCAK